MYVCMYVYIYIYVFMYMCIIAVDGEQLYLHSAVYGTDFTRSRTTISWIGNALHGVVRR